MAIIYTNQSSGAIRRLKRRKPTKAYLEAVKKHVKYLKKLGYVPKEQRQRETKPLRLDELWNNYDNRKVIPTSDKVGNGLKKSKPLYTGSAVIGQAYNKGGLQVLSTEEINDPMTGKRR